MPEILENKTLKKRTIGSRGKWYSPLTDCIYVFQSSYEKAFMSFLDNHNIKWVKNKNRFKYIVNGQEHYYIPDFYLPDIKMYIETKGFVRKSDPLKFKAFPETEQLVLLLAEDLIKLGCKVFKPVLSDIAFDKWPLNILHKSNEWQEPGHLTPELASKISSDKFFNLLPSISK